MYASYIMRILKRGLRVSEAQPGVSEAQPAQQPAQQPQPFEPVAPPPPASVPTAYYAPPRPLIARPARPAVPYTNRPPVPQPATDVVVAPVPALDLPPVTPPAPAALGVLTPALRLQQQSSTAWERIERIDRYRLARGLKLRMRVIVTVCDSERHSYANWPSATGTVEVGEAGQPGIENGKDLVWAIDELIEAVGRVGPERVARVLREVRPAPVDLSAVPVIPVGEQVG